MRYRLISCEVFCREMMSLAARTPHTVDVEFLPKGLHDLGAAPMRQRIQAALDAVDEERYDAVLFGYGLCNNGLAGLEARGLPLVLPRAHDCITLFMGSKDRYMEYFHANPGVYFRTSGWIERGENVGELSHRSIQRQLGLDRTFEELVEKYGEDNARYLWETLCEQTHNYRQYTFIEMGVEPDDRFERKTHEEADARGWAFAKIRGDMGLMARMLQGDWPEDAFLTVPPRHRVVARYDESIIAAEPVEPPARH